MKKKIPTFKTDAEAERFVATADLTEYDLSGARPMRFEFEKKGEQLNMRVPKSLTPMNTAPSSSCSPYFMTELQRKL